MIKRNSAKLKRKTKNIGIKLQIIYKNAVILCLILMFVAVSFLFQFNATNSYFASGNVCADAFNFSSALNGNDYIMQNKNVKLVTSAEGDEGVLGESDEEIADNSDIEQELSNQVQEDLNNIDFSELEVVLNEIVTNSSVSIFEEFSFSELVTQIISGNFVADFGSIINGIWQGVVEGFKTSFVPLLIVIVITLLYVLYSTLVPGRGGESVKGVIRLICLGAIVVILVGLGGKVITDCGKVISSMQTQMNAVFPILLTLMTTIGGVVSVKAYQPTVLFLSNTISNIFSTILLPVFTCVLLISVVNNFSSKRNLSKLQGFLKSFFKWVIGSIFAIYMSILSFQGITAGSSDGISIKATKYALKNYIPYLGGYVSDGFELVKASGILIKNSVGFAALLLMLASVIAPIITIAVFSLTLKLVAGIIEPLGDDKVCGFIENFASCFKMLSAIVIGIALMYFLTLLMMICTVNVI